MIIYLILNLIKKLKTYLIGIKKKKFNKFNLLYNRVIKD